MRSTGTRTRSYPARTGWRAAAVLVAVAAMTLTPCRAEPAAPTTAEAEMQRILGVKDAAVEGADRQYTERIDSADKSYEQSLAAARTAWSGKVAQARSAAVTDLKVLGARLAAAGQLADTIKVFKAVYAIKPHDSQAVKALVAAGVDLRTIAPGPDYGALRAGNRASKIVIWNTHNSVHNTSGARRCNVVLFHAGRPVWRADKVDLPWQRNKDTFAAVNVPARQFDVVRVEITKWQGYSGGLAEIEIWRGGKNVALHMPTRASAAADRRTTSDQVTDGVTSSVVYKHGYWLLPDHRAGWIEISLARPAYQKLLRAKISARKPWQKVLELAEGDVVDITATGKWRPSPHIPAGPEGGTGPGGDEWGMFRDRFYLQGRLNGEIFKIGSEFTLRAPKAGDLELCMDEEDVTWYKNNSGFLNVTLSVRKRPAPAPRSGPPPAPVDKGPAAAARTTAGDRP